MVSFAVRPSRIVRRLDWFMVIITALTFFLALHGTLRARSDFAHVVYIWEVFVTYGSMIWPMVVLLAFVRLKWKRRNLRWSTLLLFGLCILLTCSACALFAFGPTLEHWGSWRVQDRVYHLAWLYAERNFAFYECDSLGIVCEVRCKRFEVWFPEKVQLVADEQGHLTLLFDGNIAYQQIMTEPVVRPL
jgi:hypothetical protein